MMDAVTIAMAGFVPSDGGKYWADIVEEEQSVAQKIAPMYMYVKYVNISTMTSAYTNAMVIPGIGVFSRNPFTGKSTKMMMYIE